MQSKFLQNKRILITGAAGSIGSELSRQIYQMKPKKLLLLDNDETRLFDLWDELPKAIPLLSDIRSYQDIRTIFREYKPEIIFHTAAYKHVKMGELFPFVMESNNVFGTFNLLSNKFEKFIFISTDKAVNPDSVMGKTKLECERMCLERENCIIVRFGNVLGSRGSVIPIWQKQLDEGKDLTITDKRMKRYFMTIPEAVELILEAAKIGEGGEKFILDMGEQVSILSMAQKIAKEASCKIKMIGASKGEKFKEVLMTNEEKKKAKKIGKLWRIR